MRKNISKQENFILGKPVGDTMQTDKRQVFLIIMGTCLTNGAESFLSDYYKYVKAFLGISIEAYQL